MTALNSHSSHNLTWVRACLSWLVAVLPGLLGGCSVYPSMPLNSRTVEEALQPRPIESVKIAAERFDHPLIRSVRIDGEGGFTPDEIAIMVVIVSPQLRTLRDQRGLAQAQVVQAAILPHPPLRPSSAVSHSKSRSTT